jgi:hypothetical protein
MTRRLAALWLVFVALFLFVGAACAENNTTASSNHVVIITVDGMRPEFYLPGDLSAVAETLIRAL